MGLILTLAGAVVPGLVVLVLLLLSVPWVVSVVAATGSAQCTRFELRPFSAGFPARLRYGEGGGGLSAGKGVSREEGGTEAARTGTGTPATLKTRERRRVLRMLRAAPGLLTGLLKAFRIERLRLQGRVGLGDPADTGELFGAILPLSYMAPAPRFSVDLQPDSAALCSAARLRSVSASIPIRALPPVIRFGWRVFVRPA